MSDVHLISGDARRIPLADESVQCIVTSPPYWGLRRYAGEQELVWESDGKSSGHILACRELGHEFSEEQRAGISGGHNQNDKAENGDGATNRPLEPTTHGTCVRCGAWRGAFGLEPSVELYVRHSLEVLRELRRVLRKDGVLFWNLGDSYAGGGGNGGGGSFAKDGIRAPQPGSDKNVPFRTGSRGVTETSKSKRIERGTGRWGGGNNFDVSLKPKDLVLMPARIALAAQADGWWVRSMIVWAKPNPMPESVTDRPADSYEYILMLTKCAHYFWDADAVREKGAPESLERAKHGWHGETDDGSNGKRSGSSFRNSEDSMLTIPLDGRRNMRNVWDFATQPYAGAHFATFPEELPRRCILAATSARGACAQCGAPWERIVNATGGTIGRSWHDHQNDGLLGQRIADPPAEDRAKGREYDRLATRRLSEVQRILPL